MRIGIFGGSFNPPHLIHKNIALELIDKGYLDKVIYVPTGKNYPKDGLVADKARYEMVHKMILDNSNLDVSNYEFGKLTYTYQTLNYFKELYKDDEIYFICGSDNFKVIDTWRNYKYLLNNFKFIVIPRNDDNVDSLIDKFGGNVIVPNISYSVISSTKIRKILKSNRYSKKLLKLLDANTLDYIYDNNLYM